MSASILLLAVAMLLAGWRAGPPQTGAQHLVTVVQQDRFAGPFDRPSARVSARGRHVVFSSYARLVATDANQMRDVYVLDLSTGQLTLESVGRDGRAADGDSGSPDISGDGRYVVFVSSAGNLANTQIATGVPRVFLRDRDNATTRLLTTSARAGRPTATATTRRSAPMAKQSYSSQRRPISSNRTRRTMSVCI